MRVAVFTGPADVEGPVAAAVRQAAACLEEAGCTIEEVAPSLFQQAWDLHLALLAAEREGATLKEIERYGAMPAEYDQRGEEAGARVPWANMPGARMRRLTPIDPIP